MHVGQPAFPPGGIIEESETVLPGLMTHNKGGHGRWCVSQESVELQCLYLCEHLGPLMVYGLCKMVDSRWETSRSDGLRPTLGEGGTSWAREAPGQPTVWNKPRSPMVLVGDTLPKTGLRVSLPKPPRPPIFAPGPVMDVAEAIKYIQVETEAVPTQQMDEPASSCSGGLPPGVVSELMQEESQSQEEPPLPEAGQTKPKEAPVQASSKTTTKESSKNYVPCGLGSQAYSTT